MKIRFQNAKTIIENSRLKIIEIIDLKGLEEQHILFNCKLG